MLNICISSNKVTSAKKTMSAFISLYEYQIISNYLHNDLKLMVNVEQRFQLLQMCIK